jgi:hypothetical protein
MTAWDALDGARSILRAEVEELLREWESDQTHLDHRSGLRIAAAQLREVIDAGPVVEPVAEDELDLDQPKTEESSDG